MTRSSTCRFPARTSPARCGRSAARTGAAAPARKGAESGFVFVDPDGFLAEPACDCGVVLRDWCIHLLAGNTVPLAQRYRGLLAGHTGVEETAIWEWGFLERVSTACTR